MARIRHALRRSGADTLLADFAVLAMAVSVILEAAAYAIASGGAYAAAGGADQSTIVGIDGVANFVNLILAAPIGVSVLAASLAMVRSRLFPAWRSWWRRRRPLHLRLRRDRRPGVRGRWDLTGRPVRDGVGPPGLAQALSVTLLAAWVWMIATGVVLFRAAGRRAVTTRASRAVATPALSGAGDGGRRRCPLRPRHDGDRGNARLERGRDADPRSELPYRRLALITSRRPDNRIGWMFLAAGVVFALGPRQAPLYAEYGLVVAPGSSPLSDVAAWLSTLSWVPAYTLMILLLLFFPDGHLPSRRWRPILWIAAVSAVLMLVPSAIASWPYRALLLTGGSPELASDPALARADLLQGVGLALSAVVAAAGAAALIIRFRRSLGTEHRQIKLFASAAIVEMAVLIPMASGAIRLPPPVDALVAMIVTPLIPIAVGVAILRYRLYDIDRIVSRTVSYGALTGILALVFLVTILVTQTLLASFFRGSSIAVAVSTLVVAALFQPLRRRVQRAVDRRFDRARYRRPADRRRLRRAPPLGRGPGLSAPRRLRRRRTGPSGQPACQSR